MVIKAVFFDIGGTLVTSTSVLKKHVNDINRKQAESLGHKFTEEEVETARKKTDKIILDKYGNPHRKDVIFSKEMYKVLGVYLDDEIAERLEENFWEEIYNQIDLVKNSVELLSYLKDNGYKIVAVTNNQKKRAIKILVIFNIINFFDDVITSEEFGLKSTTVPFKVAMDRFNLKPKQVLMIGNNLFEDIFSSKKVGIHSVLVDFKGNLDEFYKTYAKFEDQIKPDYVVKDLIAIKGILKELNGV